MRPELTKMTTLPQSWWVKYWLRMMLQWLKLSQPSNLTGPWRWNWGYSQDELLFWGRILLCRSQNWIRKKNILSTHCESLRKKNNSLLPKGGQGNSSTIASPDLGGIRWHYIFYYIYLRITPILSERTQVIVSLATRVEVGAVVLADRGQSC